MLLSAGIRVLSTRQQQVPITNISERVGHSNSQITLSIYSHMLESENDPVVDVLNNISKNN